MTTPSKRAARTQRVRMTAPALTEKKARGEKIAAVTAYDATFASLVDRAGVDVVLVGDSLGMVIQGADSTLAVTVEDIIYHGRAVMRRTQYAHVVADMPFLSYQASSEEALRNAGRIIKEGAASAVKVEGGAELSPTITRIVKAGIPVMAHVGLQPQSVHALGGYRVQGRTADTAARIVRDAHAVADAGAYAVVLEGIPSEVAATIASELSVPTIGIGAGPHCDGQVLVCYDLLGLTPDFTAKFVKKYTNWFKEGETAVRAYCDEVRSGVFPGPEHSFAQKSSD